MGDVGCDDTCEGAGMGDVGCDDTCEGVGMGDVGCDDTCEGVGMGDVGCDDTCEGVGMGDVGCDDTCDVSPGVANYKQQYMQECNYFICHMSPSSGGLVSTLQRALNVICDPVMNSITSAIMQVWWQCGLPPQQASLDVSIPSPLNPLTPLEAGVLAKAAAQVTEARKHQANDPKCPELGQAEFGGAQ
eukprot:Em0014g77a